MATIVLEGYINKQGEKGVFNFFRRRYFRLDSNLILHYLKEKDAEELGHINLAEVERIEENYRANPRDLTGFNVVTKDRKWILNAESPAEREKWVKVIGQTIAASRKAALRSKQEATKVAARPQPKPEPVSTDLYAPSAGMFDFEEDLDAPSSAAEKYLPDGDDFDEADLSGIVVPPSTGASTAVAAAPNTNSAADALSMAMMGTSVPVSIPQRLAHTWNDRCALISDSDDESGLEFEKPHEVVARTYQEHYLNTGDFQFDVPTHKVKALI